MRSTYFGSAGSTKKRTGMCLDSPTANCCGVKQKHSVLRKNGVALDGAISGTACAQVLISGEKGGTTGKTVFIGFGIAFVHKFLTEGMNLLSTTVAVPLKLGSAATDAFSRVARR